MEQLVMRMAVIFLVQLMFDIVINVGAKFLLDDCEVFCCVCVWVFNGDGAALAVGTTDICYSLLKGEKLLFASERA
jgi:hypothetical protein